MPAIAAQRYCHDCRWDPCCYLCPSAAVDDAFALLFSLIRRYLGSKKGKKDRAEGRVDSDYSWRRQPGRRLDLGVVRDESGIV